MTLKADEKRAAKVAAQDAVKDQLRRIWLGRKTEGRIDMRELTEMAFFNFGPKRKELSLQEAGEWKLLFLVLFTATFSIMYEHLVESVPLKKEDEQAKKEDEQAKKEDEQDGIEILVIIV